MLLELVTCLLLFFLLTLGLGWPLASRLELDPAEKLGATVLLSWLGVYLVAFAIYLLKLPTLTLWILPLGAVGGLAIGARAFRATVRDTDTRALLWGQLLVSAWCLGGLWLIVSYSGGGWASDWFEHWARARFFLDHWALDTKFIELYALPARPPLANLATGALLAVTAKDFAHYQLFTALLSSLAFLPAALLVRRFRAKLGGAGRAPGAVAVLAVLLMLNPSFVENATFAWTKLLAVGFILGGLYFFLRALDPAPPRAAGPLCATALGAAILTHYSAGPYVLLLAVAWPFLNRPRWPGAAFWRQTLILGVIGALVLATWFGWSLATYGATTTFLSNSSVTVKEAQSGNQLLKIALNLRDTLVPHFLRDVDGALIAQTSPWGYWRDWFFQLYQVNLFFVYGSVGWLVILRELVRTWPDAAAAKRWFWAGFVGGVIGLGVAVHGARDTWGLAHICLQGLVVLGLVFLASRWSTLTRRWRITLVTGAVVDFCLGLALHFAVQNFAPDRWLTPDRPPWETLRTYSEAAQMNVAARMVHHLSFFRDTFPLPEALVLALLGGTLTLALIRATRPHR